jgi:hypothetical protein
MVTALQAGTITAADTGWSVGNTRDITITPTDGSEAYTAQLVIWDAKSTTGNTTATDKLMLAADETKASSFIIGIQGLTVKAAMNSKVDGHANGINEGSWEASEGRQTVKAIVDTLPEYVQNMLLEFQTVTAESYNGTETETSTDKLALPAEMEVFGINKKSNPNESVALTQFAYFEDESTHAMSLDGVAVAWWLRSPYYSADYGFCRVGANTCADAYYSYGEMLLVPFCCI